MNFCRHEQQVKLATLDRSLATKIPDWGRFRLAFISTTGGSKLTLCKFSKDEAMATIHPFTAILFHPVSGVDVTPFVAPPYDVIRPPDRERLKDRSPSNIVRLILPEDGPDGDPYQAAARMFEQWRQTGILRTEPSPAFFLWEQEFSHEGRTFIRQALVAKVNSGPYRPGEVMRHEHTHSGPKADRLRLYQATGAQFSQMFGIFRDDEGEVRRQLAEVAHGSPLRTARGDDGHISRLYRIIDEGRIAGLQASLADRTITIADGHHRYETSVAYFQHLGRPGTTLMTLVSSSDPGLLVLPTHRTVSLPLNGQSLEDGLAKEFSVERHPSSDWSRLYQAAAHQSSQGIVVAVSPALGQAFKIGWRRGAGGSASSWKRADLLGDAGMLHEKILPLISAATRSELPDRFDYLHEAEQAVKLAGERGDWAFLLRPPSVETLLQVAERQAVMPPKSTYFYPKFLAGFINADLD